MQGGLAISTLTVGVATGFILWGRTAAGKQTLTRLFGEATVRLPSKPKPVTRNTAAKPRASKKSPPKTTSTSTRTKTSRAMSSPTSSKKTKSAPRAK